MSLTFRFVNLCLARLESRVTFHSGKTRGLGPVRERIDDMLELTWLVALTAGMALWVRHDAREYRTFKALTDTKARQRYYFRWTVQSFLILTGASVATLALLDHPAAFAGLLLNWRRSPPCSRAVTRLRRDRRTKCSAWPPA